MAQYGVAKIIGEVPRPEGKRGHPEKIYSINGKAGLKVEYKEASEESAQSREEQKELIVA